MLSGTLEFAGLRAEIFHAEGSEHANQDRWFAQPHGSCLRVAAIDGATPWRSPRSPGDDAAQWAASTTLGALALPLDAESALRHANKMVHDPNVAPSRRQAMAAVAVADCYLDGSRVHWSGVVAADCEIWVADSRKASLRLVLGGDFVRADVRRAWKETLTSNNAWSLDERLAAEADLLDDPATQIRHAVGRYEVPVFDHDAGHAGVVVLASDAAQLIEAVRQGVSVSDLSAWLQGVAAIRSRDDLTCLIVESAAPVV